MSISAETVRRSVADKQYLTTGEAATITGMTVAKIRRLCESGRLPAVNTSTTDIRPRWTIRRCDLDAFLTPRSVVKAESRSATRRQRIDRDVPKIF